MEAIDTVMSDEGISVLVRKHSWVVIGDEKRAELHSLAIEAKKQGIDKGRKEENQRIFDLITNYGLKAFLLEKEQELDDKCFPKLRESIRKGEIKG